MQLAQQYPELQLIGLGAQDSLDYANEFVSSTGLGDITMVWDPSFESWRSFGIRSQPYWILYDAQGEVVESRPGAVNVEAVASLL